MIVPLGESGKLHKAAFTDWITDASGTRARYEFLSSIDEEKSVTCFLYVHYRYGILYRLLRRSRMQKSRLIGEITVDQAGFLDEFNAMRSAVWRAYDYQVPFTFLDLDELVTVEFRRGFMGKVKLNLIRAWRAAGRLRGLRKWGK